MTIPKRTKSISVILKSIVILAASFGTFLTVTAKGGMGGSGAFMYFTIQSNIAVALISAVGLVLLCRNRIGNAYYVISFVGAVSITLTCSVFTFALAPILGDLAWTIYNVLTHLVAPIAFIIDFLLAAGYGELRRKHILYVLIPPAVYVVYAAIAFAADWKFLDGKNYPYFFLNWGSPAGAFGFTGELPFMGCVWWIAALGVLIFAVGALYLRIVHKNHARVGKEVLE